MNPTETLVPPARAAGAARVLRLARLDLLLLWRNRTALFGVVGLPAFFAVMLLVSNGNGHTSGGIDAVLWTATGDVAFFLVPAVFMNLLNVFTARREELTLKRLRGGPLTDAQILGGSILSATLLYLAQAAVIVVIIATELGGGLPADPLLMGVGMLAGAAVFALLGMAVSGLTPTAELAQLTVLPVLLVSMAASGFMIPLEGLPEGWQRAAQLTPLTSVVEIVRTAYLGRDYTVTGDHAELGALETWATCLPALAVLAAWIGLSLWAARRWFRWEPRHG